MGWAFREEAGLRWPRVSCRYTCLPLKGLVAIQTADCFRKKKNLKSVRKGNINPFNNTSQSFGRVVSLYKKRGIILRRFWEGNVYMHCMVMLLNCLLNIRLYPMVWPTFVTDTSFWSTQEPVLKWANWSKDWQWENECSANFLSN